MSFFNSDATFLFSSQRSRIISIIYEWNSYDETGDAISHYMQTVLQGNAIMHKWTKDGRMMIACYIDGTRRIIFKIEWNDIQEMSEELEWLIKQVFRNKNR